MTSDLKHFESKIIGGGWGWGEDARLGGDPIGSEQARSACHLGATDEIATHVHVSVVYRVAQCKLCSAVSDSSTFCKTKDTNSFIATVPYCGLVPLAGPHRRRAVLSRFVSRTVHTPFHL